jgi:hypothetical protein
VFGNIPLLEVDDSSSSEDEEAEESEDEADANAIAVPEVAQEGESKVAQGEEDPKINEGLEEEKVPLENGEDQQEQKEGGDENGASMVEDAMDNLQASIQLADDFINSTSVSAEIQATRRAVLSNLLIDAHIRFGDISLFKEDIMGAIAQFRIAVELCSVYLDGNERTMSGTLFTIGCCL